MSFFVGKYKLRLKEEKDYLILFNLLYNIGVSYFETADYYFAEDSFRRCITLMPTNPKGFVGLSSPLYALGRKDEALDACEKALEIDPKYINAWYNKSIVLSDLGRKDEALEAYEKALEINPKYTGIIKQSLFFNEQ